MSHKKNKSMIHIPFSWEKVPGVPKFIASPMRALAPPPGLNNCKRGLPMPPGSFKLPVRSVSKRMLLREDDPFLAAMIVCTRECDKGNGEIKTSFGTRVRKSKYFLFTCKHSFDVEEASGFVKNEFSV